MKGKSLFLPALMLTVLLAGFTLVDRTTEEAHPEQVILTTTDGSSWGVDPVHSKVGFKARHFGISNVRGEFQDYDASISFDADDLSTLEASVRIRAASVFTGNDRRDGHLRSDDFFNAEVDSIITIELELIKQVA